MKWILIIILVTLAVSKSTDAQIRVPVNVSVEGLGLITVYPDQTWTPYVSPADTVSYSRKTACDSVLLNKYTRNRSEGPEDLYGVRNMRTVLKGVLYRGGGNNKYNPVCARDNNNPLATQMLFSMKSFGFSEIIYLYARNFNFYYSDSLRKTLQSQGINYESIVPNDDTIAYELLKKIYTHIKNPASGAVYVHCWNGWHMSGLVSAYSLMQFCDFSNRAALEYWKSGTDGNHNGYEKVKSRIANFKKYPELDITLMEKLRICPCAK